MGQAEGVILYLYLSQQPTNIKMPSPQELGEGGRDIVVVNEKGRKCDGLATILLCHLRVL